MLKQFALALSLSISCLTSAQAEVTLNGTQSKWHPLTLDVSGATNPLGERLGQPNPFLDFRFNVIFTSPAGLEHVVPGFFAGDGIGGGIGDIWRVRFSPDEVGEWNYEIAFHRGKNISVSDAAGISLSINGTTGSFTVNPQSTDDAGFLKLGRLEYVGEHYLKFADGPYWIKGGIDSPENFFGYAGFDNTSDNTGGVNTGSLDDGVHHYASHIADWQVGDPLFSNSANSDSAKGIIGAVNYLASEGVNSIYFLPMNLGGDGRDTHPFLGASGNDYDNTHYDISKLFQWNTVLNHMQNKGIAAHVVLAETEAGNSNWLDDGELGIQRKLFYREMVARFSYLLAVKWNLSEESRFGAEKHKQFAQYIRGLDWAKHPIAVHAYHNKPAEQYNDLIGETTFEASSIQFSPSNTNDFVETWREKSADAGRPWVIDMDEVGPALTGLTSDNADSLRRSVLYPTYFSGGNIEWYFGYHALPLGGDMRTEDFRTREAMYRYMRYAREMMQQELPFWEMQPADELHSTVGAQVFAKAADTYAVFIYDARLSGSLEVADGTYRRRWFNPRNGNFEGESTIVSGTSITLGDAPNTPGQDWVIILDSNISDTSETTENTNETDAVSPPTIDTNDTEASTETTTEPSAETETETETETESNTPSETVDTSTQTQNKQSGGSIDLAMLCLLLLITLTGWQKRLVKRTH